MGLNGLKPKESSLGSGFLVAIIVAVMDSFHIAAMLKQL